VLIHYRKIIGVDSVQSIIPIYKRQLSADHYIAAHMRGSLFTVALTLIALVRTGAFLNPCMSPARTHLPRMHLPLSRVPRNMLFDGTMIPGTNETDPIGKNNTLENLVWLRMEEWKGIHSTRLK
jgi:hypothetical protein